VGQARGGGEKRAACWPVGQKPGRKKKHFLFLFFQIFQGISKWILNFSFVFSKRAHNTK
jgi:hypothetical protein